MQGSLAINYVLAGDVEGWSFLVPVAGKKMLGKCTSAPLFCPASYPSLTAVLAGLCLSLLSPSGCFQDVIWLGDSQPAGEQLRIEAGSSGLTVTAVVSQLSELIVPLTDAKCTNKMSHQSDQAVVIRPLFENERKSFPASSAHCVPGVIPRSRRFTD